MKPSLSLLSTLVLLVQPLAAEEDWQVLFNGKDLTGWKPVVTEDSFTVVDGVLRVHAQAGGEVLDHLLYVGDREEGYERFDNFELEVTARGEADSNSGIFIHTDFTTRGDRRFLDTGYEVQMNSTRKEKRKTGSLYDVVDFKKSVVDETEWFRVLIRVEGQRITVAINGTQVVDYTEPANPKRSERRQGRVLKPEGGAIALQAHDPDSIFHFKEVRIRRLP